MANTLVKKKKTLKWRNLLFNLIYGLGCSFLCAAFFKTLLSEIIYSFYYSLSQ